MLTNVGSQGLRLAGSCAVDLSREPTYSGVTYSIIWSIISKRHTARLLIGQLIGLFPKGRWSRGTMHVVIPEAVVSMNALKDVSNRAIAHLSNQLPSTPLADRNPPTWMPSERQRSSPWKIEKVVQRIAPPGVCLTEPLNSVNMSITLLHLGQTYHGSSNWHWDPSSHGGSLNCL